METHIPVYIFPTTITDMESEVNATVGIFKHRHELFAIDTVGHFVCFAPITIDGMSLSISFFPRGHDANPTGAALLTKVKCSLGLSIANKLDVLHRLKRCGAASQLFIDIKIGGHTTCKLEFDLRDFVTKNNVFKELSAVPDDLQNTKKVFISAKLKYQQAWDRAANGRIVDEFRLKLYRIGLIHGDVELYLIPHSLIQSDKKRPFPVIDRLQSDDIMSADSGPKFTVSRFPITTDDPIKIGKIVLKAGNKHFVKMFRFDEVDKIGISAPSIMHINTFAFWCCTGELHNLTDTDWFVKLSHYTDDQRMLGKATALCIQRLGVNNVLGTCRLFEEVRVSRAHGLLDLQRWIEMNKAELQKELLDDEDAKHGTTVYSACKKVLWWM